MRYPPSGLLVEARAAARHSFNRTLDGPVSVMVVAVAVAVAVLSAVPDYATAFPVRQIANQANSQE